MSLETTDQAYPPSIPPGHSRLWTLAHQFILFLNARPIFDQFRVWEQKFLNIGRLFFWKSIPIWRTFYSILTEWNQMLCLD